ncbi:MAG: hypothetical protein ACYTAN_18570 [Planctomycetota bacterium]|jgi:hypothetical protein
MLRKMSLRKRILIAAAAIGVIHFLFWFTPRWWVTRPRFYEDAWREAVSILEEEVGAKAVEAGLARIPRAKISVPYEGECTVRPVWYSAAAWVSVSPSECWLLIGTEGGKPAQELRRARADGDGGAAAVGDGEVHDACGGRHSPLAQPFARTGVSGPDLGAGPTAA